MPPEKQYRSVLENRRFGTIRIREKSKICYFVEKVQKYYENKIFKNRNKSGKLVKNKINWKIDKEKLQK